MNKKLGNFHAIVFVLVTVQKDKRTRKQQREWLAACGESPSWMSSGGLLSTTLYFERAATAPEV
ncbi:hypothetical protein T08_3188 [Trichinella sp. T8]|nr:hypothetical protein T08_3188 [Trichinella sp. T8]